MCMTALRHLRTFAVSQPVFKEFFTVNIRHEKSMRGFVVAWMAALLRNEVKAFDLVSCGGMVLLGPRQRETVGWTSVRLQNGRRETNLVCEAVQSMYGRDCGRSCSEPSRWTKW